MLVTDEPVATIVAEALNGFASGRFQSQSEVKRFLDSKPEYPKNYRGTEVQFDRGTVLLKYKIYAGFVEKADWGIPLTKAQHEALISLDTHRIIQDRLADRNVAPARKDIDQDYPLWGFLCVKVVGTDLLRAGLRAGPGGSTPTICAIRALAQSEGSLHPKTRLKMRLRKFCKKFGLPNPRSNLRGACSVMLETVAVRWSARRSKGFEPKLSKQSARLMTS